jgi:hypothetical protein
LKRDTFVKLRRLILAEAVTVAAAHGVPVRELKADSFAGEMLRFAVYRRLRVSSSAKGVSRLRDTVEEVLSL